MTRTTIALVLAGGRGSRLSPLTDHRPKPAVPLFGSFSLIDVTLSNLAHSGLRNVWIAEQYLPNHLNHHLAGGRPWDLDGTRDGLRVLPPREGGEGDGFTEGNGHALYQHLAEVERYGADTLVVCSADHLYQLDFRDVLEQHDRLGSDLTVVTTEVAEDPSRYGVVASHGGEVVAYDYKPESPTGCVVATEVFVYSVGALRKACDALVDADSDGADLADYGDTIVPYMVKHCHVHEFRMEGYWRDLGTIDAYFQAHMELIDDHGLDIFRTDWPLMTNLHAAPPARVHAKAEVHDSLLCPGANVSGNVEHSVIGPGVVVEAGATVRRSILIGDVRVPAGAVLESVIGDRGAHVPAGRTGATKPGPGNITVLSVDN